MLPLDKSLLDHLPGYIGWKNVDRHYQGANQALLKFKGIKDITGKTDEEISPASVADNRIYLEHET